MTSKSFIIACLFVVLAEFGVRPEPTITPAIYQLVPVPGTATVRGTFRQPLVGCKVRVTEHNYHDMDKVLDYSTRLNSKQDSKEVKLRESMTANFAGQSPNECGVLIRETSYWTYYLLIEIYGRSEGGEWRRGWAMVILSGVSGLTSTSSTPVRIVSTPGSNVSLLLKTQKALYECVVETTVEPWLQLWVGTSLPHGSRYRLHGAGLDKGECGITLTGLTTRDSGVWNWHGIQGKSYWFGGYHAQHMTMVLVASAPVGKPVLSVPNASRLRVGDVMEATCRVPPGVPPPKLTWLLDGQVVRQDDGNATLPVDVAKSLPWQPQGAVQTYTRTLSSQDYGKRLDCRAEHSAGVDIVSLVLTPLYLTVRAESPLIHTGVGHPTELACIVEAGPAATVQWRRAGDPVNPSSLLRIGNNGTRHWLQLDDVTDGDLRNFTCTASNKLGSESKVVQLTGLPGIPRWKEGTSPPQLAWIVETLEELTSCKLKFRLEKDRWQKLEVVGGVRRLNNTWVLVQHHLQVEVAGNYSVYLIVRNRHGESPPSSFQMFSMNATAATLPPTPTAEAGACPALVNTSSSVECTLAGQVVDCSVGPVPLGTNARIECLEGSMPSVEQHGARNTTCSAGRWSPKPLACVLDCGFRRKGATPTIKGGKESSEGEFPWHVAVFEKKLNDSFEPICGGSLITRSFFVSAAHCFWRNTPPIHVNVSLYYAVVGKHSLSWETRDPYEQRLEIKAIHIPEHYDDYLTRFEADISVVELSAPINITHEANVVCMDWTTKTEYQQLTINSNGTVPGWGLTENDTMSSTLRHVDLPFVPYLECKASVPWDYRNFLIRDKICGGYRDRSTGVCQGDSGGGFVFPAQRAVGTRYILRGLVSNSPSGKGRGNSKCWAESMSAFTKVSSYVSWIEGIVFAEADEEGR